MALNPILSGIPAYVDETREQLISRVVLGGESIAMADLITGAKGPVAMHFLDSTVTFGDANSCSFDPTDEHTISQRIVTPKYLKVNQTFCDKNLLGSYAAHQVKIAAGVKTLPYEAEMLDQVSKGIQNKLEVMFWQGDSAKDPNSFDGILKTAVADGANVITKAKGTSLYTAVKEGYLSLKEELMQDDLTIFMSDGAYRNLIQELVALNFYHIFDNDNSRTTVLPGTNCKIVAVHGLNGADSTNEVIVFARKSNLVYATDMQNDSEVFDFWYSADDRVFKLAVEFMAGANVKYPDEITVLKVGK